MKRSSSSTSSANSAPTLAFTPDQILALLQREDQYLCQDYTSASFNLQQEQDDNNGSCDAIMRKVPSTCSLRDVQAERRATILATTPEFTLWRHQMFDWACMVVDNIGADRESVACSFAMLDRFLVTELQRTRAPAVTRDDYQLFCMTCLYICTKIMDPFPLSVQCLVDMSKSYYTQQVIEQTEMDILTALNWRIHSPTALTYARLYSQLLHQHQAAAAAESTSKLTSSANHHQQQQHLPTVTEIAVSSGSFISCRPSIVGLASVLLSANVPADQLQCFLKSHVDLLPQDGEEFRHVYTQLETLCS